METLYREAGREEKLNPSKELRRIRLSRVMLLDLVRFIAEELRFTVLGRVVEDFIFRRAELTSLALVKGFESRTVLIYHIFVRNWSRVLEIVGRTAEIRFRRERRWEK